ncbi:phosphoribosylaminoimidazole-succinocarboxamide synthase [Lentzea sp. NBRC 105346]|uniref:phosphoribosylaminoimidazolesuccinocarboxamide synthase n=1 Tax=Lentzea sp. NBRC 105346 TaxID=3032205 RepID=UPI0024A1976E|nr:phosphoribosylaminoimidazolesuccinocarboxamide synthase [Lentzea sp. NBRC 105346]GLZ33292.1 phosphoribosylaminoimidazole-succinocarboxamide synthase [Lentzea sp. NBRC 105346]
MSTLADYQHIARGKVRDLYEVDDELLLFVASDRISAYDYVLSTPIPDKGRILTAMSVFWFERFQPNHLVAHDDSRIPAEVKGRALLVRKLKMIDVECVARGYLTGSGLKDYQATGAVCGVELPAGLREADELAEPIFTPATKAEIGAHDENVSFDVIVAKHGQELAEELRDRTVELYRQAREYARSRGVILADTKFEFGHDEQGNLVLADEVFTPDSSRYWPAEGYAPGRVQPSFDKQFVRDWLTANWDRQGTPPPLPDDVVEATRKRYVEAYELITGRSFADWLG